MKKTTMKLLSEGFTPPKPRGKRGFLRRAPVPRISMGRFLLGQLRYIRPWVWAAALAATVIPMLGLKLLEGNSLAAACAMSPVLAMLLITETGRSQTWGMVELEQASRFSLKSVVLARAIALGAVSGVGLLALTLSGAANLGLSPGKVGVYMLCPYLSAAYLSLWVCRRLRGREAGSICLGIGSFVSLCFGALPGFSRWLFEDRVLAFWVIACAALAAAVFREGKQMIYGTEELQWSC